MKRLSVTFRIEPDGAVQIAKGRDAWALLELEREGERGCTPITTPGPRWSAYVHRLRHLGVVIETVHEHHGGPFPGTHGRYVLHSRIAIAETRGGETACAPMVRAG